MVTLGLNFHLALSNTLFVTLIVTKIIHQDGTESIKEANPEDASSDSVAASSTYTTNGFLSYISTVTSVFLNPSTVSIAPSIALLTNKTLLIVEPFSDSISPPNSNPEALDNDLILRTSYDAFSLHCLHLLPERYRRTDTRYFREQKVQEQEKMIDLDFNHVDDGMTCYLNPFQEYTVLRLLSITDLSASRICKILSSQRWILKRHESHREGLSFTTPLRIMFSPLIRPFHILVPTSVRSELRILNDNDKVSLINITKDYFAYDFPSNVDNRSLHQDESDHLSCFDTMIYYHHLMGNRTRSCNNLYSPEKQVKFISSIISEIFSCFLPSSVLNKITHGVRAPIGLIIYGGHGSGKSYLLETIRRSLELSPIFADISQADGLELRRCESQELNDRIAALFSPSKSSGRGRLVFFDNIDALCPYVPDSESFLKTSSNSHTSANLSTQLESFFEICSQRSWNELIRSRSLISDHSESLGDLSSLFDSSASSYALSATIDLAVANNLRCTTFVIATCTSLRSINPKLIVLFGLRKSFAIPLLDAPSRMSFLRWFLDRQGIPLRLDIGVDMDRNIESDLISHTEGMSPLDLKEFARRLLLRSSRRYALLSRSSGDESDIAVSEMPLIRRHVSFSDVFDELYEQRDIKENSFADWDSIVGLTEAKRKVLSVLHAPVAFSRLLRAQKSPIRLSKGILLYGPPGCGKTMLAVAAARKCGVSIISVKGPELLNKYIGASEKAVRDLVQRASSTGKPCVIFFDEFEALAARRGKDNTGVTDRVVNQLLTLIDGAETTSSVDQDQQIFFMAASSRPDLIDPALLRPGRLETHVYVGAPESAEDRLQVLRSSLATCLKGTFMEPQKSEFIERDKVLERISSHDASKGLSTADLRAIISSSFISAIHGAVAVEAASVKISGNDIWNAFISTRPSISEADKQFYFSLRSQFR